MITQIVVIIVILVLLYLLLRHWPETEAPGKSVGWSGASKIIDQPKLSSLSRLGGAITRLAEQTWRFLKRLFTDDKKNSTSSPVRSIAAKPLAQQGDEFSKFIGVPEAAPKKSLPWQRPDTRSARVGREKTLAGPLSPIRAAQKPATPTTGAKPGETASQSGWFGRFSVTKQAETVAQTQSEVDILLGKAETAKRNNSFAEAEKLLVKAAAKEPRNAKVYAKLGLLYLEQGENWLEAEESFKQALRFDADNGFIHNNLGLVLYNQDRFVAAAKEFEAACRIDDSLPSRHANLGLCYLSMRQYSKAEQEFKRAVRLDSDNEEYEELLKEASEKRRTHRSN